LKFEGRTFQDPFTKVLSVQIRPQFKISVILMALEVMT
jgi:hypothetical protein